jgi:hypothetical protein
MTQKRHRFLQLREEPNNYNEAILDQHPMLRKAMGEMAKKSQNIASKTLQIV